MNVDICIVEVWLITVRFSVSKKTYREEAASLPTSSLYFGGGNRESYLLWWKWSRCLSEQSYNVALSTA